MKQYVACLCTDIKETGLSHVIFLRFLKLYVVHLFFFVGYMFLVKATADLDKREERQMSEFVFNAPPTAKAILRKGATSLSHPTDWRSQASHFGLLDTR